MPKKYRESSSRSRNNAYRRFIKRVLDVMGAVFLLVITSWIFILIILIYILQLKFPVFFVHQRIGKGESVFRMFKFRTLKANGASLQERRFLWGDILRRTSLDELPQLINILRGEMSFVGPRPLPVEYLPLFSEEQRRRHQVKPGVTGMAQVNGRHSISWDQKFAWDLSYVNNISFTLDLKILLKTIVLVLSFRKDTSLTEPKFTGNN